MTSIFKIEDGFAIIEFRGYAKGEKYYLFLELVDALKGKGYQFVCQHNNEHPNGTHEIVYQLSKKIPKK